MNVEKSTPSPIQLLKCCPHGLFGATLCIPEPISKALSNCLICLSNQHANKNTYFFKAATRRNDTPIKPKMCMKKPETDRLIVDSPPKEAVFVTREIGNHRNFHLCFVFQPCFECFCVHPPKCPVTLLCMAYRPIVVLVTGSLVG